MLRQPRFKPLLRSTVNVLILAGFCVLHQTELLAQKKSLPAPVLEGCSCQNCQAVVIPPAVADVLQTIVCKHFDIVVNLGGKYTAEQRLNALNVIAIAASKKEYQDKKQWQNIISRLQIMLYVSEEDHALQREIVRQLPRFMHYEVTSATPPAASSSGAACAGSNQNKYEKLVIVLKDYLGRPPVCYEKSWQVTSALKSGLLELTTTKAPALSPDQKCGYCILTCALNKIVLNDRVDTQVRFNAMNALVKKGDQFLKLKVEGEPDKGVEYDNTKDSQLFYFIIQRLNELLTDKKAECLPDSIRDKANYDMMRFLGYDLTPE